MCGRREPVGPIVDAEMIAPLNRLTAWLISNWSTDRTGRRHVPYSTASSSRFACLYYHLLLLPHHPFDSVNTRSSAQHDPLFIPTMIRASLQNEIDLHVCTNDFVSVETTPAAWLTPDRFCNMHAQMACTRARAFLFVYNS